MTPARKLKNIALNINHHAENRSRAFCDPRYGWSSTMAAEFPPLLDCLKVKSDKMSAELIEEHRPMIV
jgi:hypothetical protein